MIRQAIASGFTLLQLEDFSRAFQIGPTMPHNEAENQELKWCLKAWLVHKLYHRFFRMIPTSTGREKTWWFGDLGTFATKPWKRLGHEMLKPADHLPIRSWVVCWDEFSSQS